MGHGHGGARPGAGRPRKPRDQLSPRYRRRLEREEQRGEPVRLQNCAHCGAATERPRFCSDKCRKRAWSRRRAGIPEDAYIDAGHRGPVPLGTLTKAEKRERESRGDLIREARDRAKYLGMTGRWIYRLAAALEAAEQEIEHHVEELEIRMADITRLTAERDELRAWVEDMERRDLERKR